MIEYPEIIPIFQRELARPEGLTMISCKFKKGIISDIPIEIPEEKFLKNQKKKLMEQGIDVQPPPDEDQENLFEGANFLFE